ncbi:MAG: hypothetical protein ACOH1I_06645 [Gallionellaceae bacterium]|jgi:hypothetical protein
MKLLALSTEQAPSIHIPLRFFATAPLFLLLAALMLAMNGSNPFENIHTPALLAATHSITLGFITMIMLGALLQVLPVVFGSPLPATQWVAWLSHLALVAGTLFLSAGFILNKPALLAIAWMLLGLAFAVFISAALFSLLRSTAKNTSKTAIFLAVLALCGAVILGMLLARGYAAGLALDYPSLAAAHVSLALGGWVLLLIIGVAYQVVPLFQLTPNYPTWLTLTLAPAIFGFLLASIILPLFISSSRWLETIPTNLFWASAVYFSITTLILQKHRRRRIPDATLMFFRIGMSSLLAVAILATAIHFVDQPELLKIQAGLLFLLGFAMSLIFGMLYKIVPFLIWFHLFRGGTIHTIPNMKQIIPEVWMWRHLKLHAVTLAAVLMAPWWDIAAWLFVLCLLLQGVLLSYTLYTAIAIYQRTLQKLLSCASGNVA